MGLAGELGARKGNNMSKMTITVPESVEDALKYGADCYGRCKVGIYAGDSDSGAIAHINVDAEWFVGLNGGKAANVRAGDVLNPVTLREIGTSADDTITLIEAQ